MLRRRKNDTGCIVSVILSTELEVDAATFHPSRLCKIADHLPPWLQIVEHVQLGSLIILKASLAAHRNDCFLTIVSFGPRANLERIQAQTAWIMGWKWQRGRKHELGNSGCLLNSA